MSDTPFFTSLGLSILLLGVRESAVIIINFLNQAVADAARPAKFAPAPPVWSRKFQLEVC
jgi:hypothetical protein